MGVERETTRCAMRENFVVAIRAAIFRLCERKSDSLQRDYTFPKLTFPAGALSRYISLAKIKPCEEGWTLKMKTNEIAANGFISLEIRRPLRDEIDGSRQRFQSFVSLSHGHLLGGTAIHHLRG